MTARPNNFKAWHIIPLVLFFPLSAAYGLYLLLCAILHLGTRVSGAQAALGATLRCANGHANATTGRFECGVCHATYHGWIGRCSLCGAGAGWTPCEICQTGIRLPWARR